MITEEELEKVRKIFPPIKTAPYKKVWLLDCFRYRTNPEVCDPNGCSKCNQWKELEARYNDTK